MKGHSNALGMHGLAVVRSLIKLKAAGNSLSHLEDTRPTTQEVTIFKDDINENVATTLVHASHIAGVSSTKSPPEKEENCQGWS